MVPSRIGPRVTLGVIKIAVFFATFMVLGIKSCVSQSNSERSAMDDSPHKKTTLWDERLRRLKPRTRPVYVGFDISSGAPCYRLNSNVAVLNSLPVNYFGGMVGGMLANPVAKLKSGIGLYYSGDNVPFTFDLLTANLSVNVYPLRIKQVRYHTVEPYILSGIAQMKNMFYGHYLSDPSTKINFSSSEHPYIGAVLSTHLLAGAGVEYQLENDKRDFIHVYAEVCFGSNLGENATTDALSDSTIPRSLWITIGMSLGKFK